jgi:hypothetical protein
MTVNRAELQRLVYFVVADFLSKVRLSIKSTGEAEKRFDDGTEKLGEDILRLITAEVDAAVRAERERCYQIALSPLGPAAVAQTIRLSKLEKAE